MTSAAVQPHPTVPRDDIRVLVVDSSRILRETLADLMQYLPGLRCVGTAQTGKEAVELTRRECPDAVLVDSEMPDMVGPRVVQLIRAAYPPTHIIGFSLHPDGDTHQALLRAGADAFVGKNQGIDELVGVIRELGLVPEPERTACEERAAEPE